MAGAKRNVMWRLIYEYLLALITFITNTEMFQITSDVCKSIQDRQTDRHIHTQRT
jgi:hypothetical protein